MIHGIDISNATIFYMGKATDIGQDCEIKLTNVNLVTFDK